MRRKYFCAFFYFKLSALPSLCYLLVADESCAGNKLLFFNFFARRFLDD